MSSAESTKSNRILGLDSIRFLAAVWVMFYHVGTSSLYEHLDRSNLFGKVLGAGLDCIFNGPAAVIVFFVISGFCIHYPFREKEATVHIPSFLIRRYIRILIPLLLCLGLTLAMGLPTDTVGRLVGWSIECELIYYTIYPVLLQIGRKVGWGKLVALFLPVSLIYIGLTNPRAGMYPSFGLWGNALIGLPCWILGVKLAEYSPKLWKPSLRNLWISRALLFFASMLCFSMMLHMKIGLPWSLNFFAVLSFFWLSQEIHHFQNKLPIGWLEWGGKWSYSLYLIHGPLNVQFDRWELNLGGNLIEWGLKILFILIFSYVFYLIVEKPSHQLARYLGKLLSSKSK